MGVEHKLDSGVGLLSLLKSRIFKPPKNQTCLSTLMKSRRSAPSTIGMPKARSTCTTSWTSSALGMNIIKKTTVKFGQTDDFGKKFCKYDEVVKLMQEAVKEPDSTGNYHDYVELCKLYDKNENGTILLAELENILSNLGDMIPKEDCQKMLEGLAPKEDEDGLIPYTPFLDKLCGKA